VDDWVTGLIKLMKSDCIDPINLGNATEFAVLEFADVELEIVGNEQEKSRILSEKGLPDDLKRRKQDILRAIDVLGGGGRVRVEEKESKK